MVPPVLEGPLYIFVKLSQVKIFGLPRLTNNIQTIDPYKVQ